MVVASRYMEGAEHRRPAAGACAMSEGEPAEPRCIAAHDPHERFFVVRRTFLDRVVRRLYGRGFKVLLDLVAAARGEVTIVERPYRMRSRLRGESKLGARVIAEFLMLILYHLTGRLLPARFFLFGAVGLTGVAVHLAVLWAAFAVTGAGFMASQLAATWVAMTSNFFLNNAFTYGDQRLRGRTMWRGLASFYVACSIGAFINVAMAEWLYLQSVDFRIAGLTGG